MRWALVPVHLERPHTMQTVSGIVGRGRGGCRPAAKAFEARGVRHACIRSARVGGGCPGAAPEPRESDSKPGDVSAPRHGGIPHCVRSRLSKSMVLDEMLKVKFNKAMHRAR